MNTYQAIPPLPLTTALVPGLTPTQYLEQTLEYLATLDERPAPDFVREVAALEEVITYPEDVQQARYDSHCARLLSGVPLAVATPDQLRCDGLALFGLAKDRAANGVWAFDADVWVEAAAEAISRYQTRMLQPA